MTEATKTKEQEVQNEQHEQDIRRENELVAKHAKHEKDKSQAPLTPNERLELSALFAKTL